MKIIAHKDLIVGKTYQYGRHDWDKTIKAEIVQINKVDKGVILEGATLPTYLDGFPFDGFFIEQ